VNYGSGKERFQNLLREDTKELLGFLSAKSIAGTVTSTRHDKKGRNGCFTQRKTKNNPQTITYLAKAWGVGKNFPLQNVKKGAAPAFATTLEQTTNPTNLSVINSLEATKVHYSAKSLFVANRICERVDQEAIFAHESKNKAERINKLRKQAKAEWVQSRVGPGRTKNY
jgi:hypothetical protein